MEMLIVFNARQAILCRIKKNKKTQDAVLTQHQYQKPPLVKAISLSGKHNNHIPPPMIIYPMGSFSTIK